MLINFGYYKSNLTYSVFLIIFFLFSIGCNDNRPKSRYDYAKICERDMGFAIPDFDCTKGVEILINKNNKISGCNNPALFHHDKYSWPGKCEKGSYLLLLNKADKNIITAAICRKYYSDDVGFFHDIALIQYNKATGNTCFYQTEPGKRINGTKVRSPQHINSLHWLEPGKHGLRPSQNKSKDIVCIDCHEADPFVWSPYVNLIEQYGSRFPASSSIMKTIKQYDEILWKTKKKAWNSNFQNLFGKSARSFAPNENKCTSCHRIGELSCNINHNVSFQDYMDKHWMPPGGKSCKEYDKSVEQLNKCCDEKTRESSCNLKLSNED